MCSSTRAYALTAGGNEMYRYKHEPDPNVEGSGARVLTINRLQRLVNQDAHRRGLYEGLTGMDDKTMMRRGIWRIMDEMHELTVAVLDMRDGDPVTPDVADELADVVITALSFAE